MTLKKIDIKSKIRDVISEKFRELQQMDESQQSNTNRTPKLTHDMVLQEIKKKGTKINNSIH